MLLKRGYTSKLSQWWFMLGFKIKFGASKMTQWVKVATAKPEGLTMSPGTHRVEQD